MHPDDVDTVTVLLNDNGNTGTGGGADQTLGTVNVDISAVNDAPVVTGPGSAYSFTEQGSLDIHGTGFSVADVDDNGGTMTATLSVGEGRVLIDAGDSGVVLTSGNFNSSGNSTDSVTFTGTKSQINALLSGTSTGRIVYYHDLTTGSDVPSASTTITLTVNDQGNTGIDPGNTGDGSSEEHAASQVINITSVNDAPSLLGPNVISNGDFASDLTGWTTTGAAEWSFGRAIFGNSNVVGPHSLSQTFATSAGETYLLEFDYRDGHANLNQQLEVTVDGSANLLTTEQILTDTDGSTFVRYRFSFTADSPSATITFTDTSDETGSMSASTIGVNGVLDNVSVRQTGGQLGTAAFTEDGSAVVLDSDLTLFDAEIDAGLDDFDGATLTLVRNGAASNDDVFSGSGNLVLNAGTLELSAVNIGTYTNTGGQLSITFNGTPSAGQINEVLQSIAYENTSDVPPASVQIDWTFNDNNDGSQGTGGALNATGYTVVHITATNDDPTNAGGLPSDVAATEDVLTAVDLSSVDFSDVDAGSSDLTVTLSTSTGGSLTLAADANIDFGGTPDARTLTGTLAELNAYFDIATNIQYLHGTQHTVGDDADTITVVINDHGNTGSGGGSDQLLGTINVDIAGVNDAPTTTPVTLTAIAEDSGTRTITQAELLGSANDVDGDSLVASGLTLSAGGGVLVDNGNGTWDYTPDLDDDSAVSFSYAISDGIETNSGSATLDITPVNDEQVLATNAGATVAEGSTGNVVTSAMLLTTDVDNSDGQLSYTVTSIPANGTLRLNGVALAANDSFTQADIASGLVTYDHDGGESASDSFSFAVDDGQGISTSSSFGWTVTPVNDSPTVQLNTGANVSEGGSVMVTSAMLLEGDPDDDWDGIDLHGHFHTQAWPVGIDNQPGRGCDQLYPGRYQRRAVGLCPWRWAAEY